MKIKYYALILVAAFSAGLISGCSKQPDRTGHNHLEAKYVPWGVDEFELYGLTKNEITQKFKGEMHLSEEEKAISWDDGRPGHFHLGFDDTGRVGAIRRIFIDGAGCEIKGPELNSKEKALQFSIEGLSHLSHLDKDDQSKLAAAKKQLAELK